MTHSVGISPGPSSSRSRINWTVVGVVVAIVVAIAGWIGSGASDYRKLTERVVTLETQRAEDARRLERIESKLDRLLERK